MKDNLGGIAPIFAISRLRMGIDGAGITTLVTFMGCPLNCKYCLNDRCHAPIFKANGVTPRKGMELLSPQELYEKVKIDNLYFQASGGGEPTMYEDFIIEFRKLCGDEWRITLETSLYDCPYATLQRLAPIIDKWIVDVENLRRSEEQQPNDLIVATEGMPALPKDIQKFEGDVMPIDDLLPPGIPAIEGDMRYIPELDIKKERKLYKKCFIAGIGFHDIEEIWDELYVGAKLALVRDKNNKHDKNAVAVALADDYDGDPEDFDFDFILGYVPRSENEQIATILDMGWSELIECEISALNEHRPYQERIEISVYIISKDDVERGIKIRALLLDDKGFQKVTDDLETQGNTYFRWGGFPPWQHNLPKKSDNVVFIHRRDEYSILYLMHVIAIGDDAYPFVEDKEELNMVDDCCHYVFTNVKGPIKRHNTELKFLNMDELDTHQPETYLSQEATEMLQGIFDELI